MSHHLVRLPMVLPSDRTAMDFALASLGQPDQTDQGIVWIRNTQDLARIAISERLASEASGLPGWNLLPESFEPHFDTNGNLVTPL